MAQLRARYVDLGDAVAPARFGAIRSLGPAYQAYLILRFAFVVAPIVAGLDKFFGLGGLSGD